MLDKRGSTLAGHFHSKRAQEGLLYSVMRHVSNQLAKLSGENGTKKCYDPVIGEDFLGGFPRLATGSGMIVTEKACDLSTYTNMVPHLLFHRFLSSPTTSQSVFPVADQRLP